MGKNIISFEIYRKATENPLFQILKRLNQKDKNKYQLKDASGSVVKISDNLNSILKIISKKCSRKQFKVIK
jgi:DNA-binding TFAR19-related protein (PDSD5 family)